MKPFTAFLLLGTLGMVGCGKLPDVCVMTVTDSNGNVYTETYHSPSQQIFVSKHGDSVIAVCIHQKGKECVWP
jgi:hypothetical protein